MLERLHISSQIPSIASSIFPKDADKDQPEEATDRLVVQLKAAQTAMESTKRFLSGRQRDAKGNEAHTEALAELNTRVQETQTAMTKHRKVAGAYEAIRLVRCA